MGGGYAVASQVNSNFDTLYNWVNGGGAIWSDASVSFTAVPSGPSTDPTAPNHLVRKNYVDTLLGGNGFILKADSTVVSTNSGGGGTVAFSPAFPNTLKSVIICEGDWSTDPAVTLTVIWSSGTGRTGFNFHADKNGSAVVGSVRVNWIAVGT